MSDTIKMYENKISTLSAKVSYWKASWQQEKDREDARRMGIDLALWIQAGLMPALTIESGTVTRPAKYEGKDFRSVTKEESGLSPASRPDLPPEIWELRDLMRKNPGTQIINTPERFTVLRNDRFVGGRINELVFRTPSVTEYLMTHPAETIDAGNLIV